MADKDALERNHSFVDGLSGIGFVGGVVRCDLATFSGENDSAGNPVLSPYQRLVISPKGFLQMLSVFQDLANKMEEAGVLSRVKNDAEGDIQ